MENLTLEEFLKRINPEYRWWAERAAKKEDVIGLFAHQGDDVVLVDTVHKGDPVPWEDSAYYSGINTVAYWCREPVTPDTQAIPSTDTTLPRRPLEELRKRVNPLDWPQLDADKEDATVLGMLFYESGKGDVLHCIPVYVTDRDVMRTSADWEKMLLHTQGQVLKPVACWIKE